jgi:hypothetical protein
MRLFPLFLSLKAPMSDSIGFDPERAYRHTEALCYPRRVGTSGEKRAADYVAEQLTAQGLQVRREPFRVSPLAIEFGGRLAFLVCAGLVAAGAVLAVTKPFLAACSWTLAALAVNAPWLTARYLKRWWPGHAQSENILAALPPGQRDAPVRVIFMAHYDTKSQLLPTGARVLLVCGITALCVMLALAGFSKSAGLAPRLQLVPWPFSAVIGVFLTGLVLNVTGNRSPGAIDNGSSVGTLLELARSWRPLGDLPAEAIWVATGCEEVDLDGARHFLAIHRSWWQDKPTLLINLESVGPGHRLYLAGETQALSLAAHLANELGIHFRRLRILGVGMDHEPFAARRLPAISILGDVVAKSLVLHSARDDMSMVDKSALERAGRLAGHLAWAWAKLHQPTAVAAPELDGFPVAARAAMLGPTIPYVPHV